LRRLTLKMLDLAAFAIVSLEGPVALHEALNILLHSPNQGCKKILLGKI